MLATRGLRQLIAIFRRHGVERDLDDELGFHLAMRIERNKRDGMTPDAAARNAHRRFGDIEEVKTAMRKANRPSLTQLLWSPVAIGALVTLLVAVGAGMWVWGWPAENGSAQTAADITMPRPFERPRPSYTAAALEAKIQGAVIMTCIVQIDGACTDIDVVESLDTRYGLDTQATDTLAKWRFEPGMQRDEPVPVSVTVEMTFTLR